MHISEFQDFIRKQYYARDSERGTPGTFLWFVEEVGELTRALRRGYPKDEVAGEFADVLAWLVSLASLAGVDIQQAATEKYFKDGVPGHEKDKAREAGEAAAEQG